MAEILDAFCERCGKAAVSPLAKAPAGSKGLRRLLPSAKTKVETPMSALRLCLGCRGYVCDECWNEPASVCQSCQPLDGQPSVAPNVIDELMATAGYAPAAPEQGMAFANGDGWNGIDDAARLSALTSWPETDLRRTADQPDAEAATQAADLTDHVDDFVDAAELAPEVEEALAAAEQPAADEFEDRWAELLDRVHAVGVGELMSEEAAAEPEPEVVAESEQQPEPVAHAGAAFVVEPELVDDAAVAVEPELAVGPELAVEPDLISVGSDDAWFGLEEAFDPKSVYFDESALVDEPVLEVVPDATEEPLELAAAVEAEPVVVDEMVSDEESAVASEAVEVEPLVAEETWDTTVAVEAASASALEDPAYVESRWQAQAALSEMLENLHEVLEVASGDVAAVEVTDNAETALQADAEVDEPVVEDVVSDEAVVVVAEPEPLAEAESFADEAPVFAESFEAEAEAAAQDEPEHVAEVVPVAEVEPNFDADQQTDDAIPTVDAEARDEEPVVASAETESTPEPAATVNVAAEAVVVEELVDERDPDEELWAALLTDAAEPTTDGNEEPDRAELEQVLRPRRVRHRIVRQSVRRPVQPEAAADRTADEVPALPPPPPPVTADVPPAPPAPPRVLHLPPAPLPRPPAATTPWPMPAPPAFLPPPPPAMLSNVQPAPARFRPQVAVAQETVAMPTTRPCLKCGLELSAKVAFCRRCGSRQTPA